jgi:hypothetical protein
MIQLLNAETTQKCIERGYAVARLRVGNRREVRWIRCGLWAKTDTADV